MDESRVLKILEGAGAVSHGHFLLSSGRHSDTYVQCSQVLKEPATAIELGRAIAEKVEGAVDVVLCPALGAIVLGFTTALALGVEMVFAERVEGRMRLRRGFRLRPGLRVLIVEDVITTGGSVLELARMVEDAGARVTAIACLVDRAGMEAHLHPILALARLEVGSYEPDECPLCRSGEPLQAPGSKYI